MHSIKQKSMYMLSAISLLVMLIAFSFCYFAASNYFDKQLDAQIQDTNRALAIVMQEPIFAYDTELTNDILKSFVAYPHLLSVVAFDHRGKRVGNAADNVSNLQTHDMQQTKVDILWEGKQKIGYVEASYLLDTNAALLSTTKWALIIMAIVLIAVLAAANWIVLSRFVIAPLEQVTAALSEIAQGGGDLRSRLNINSKDEMGKLGQVFDGFVSNLQVLIKGLVESAATLESCAKSIEQHAQNNELETQQQLTEIADISAAVDQMSKTTEDVSNIAVQTSDKTKNCHELANSGNQTVQKTISDIHNLGDSIADTSDKISDLKNKSEQINTVLTVIKGIAEQTNLLALNAAIEAARAGEQGRGFAVVADEVRALAQRTQDSTKEIETIIHDLQHSSESANALMKTTKEKLSETINESSHVIHALDDIITNIQVINEMNAGVARSTEEQTVATDNVSSKAVSINHLTEEVAQGAKASSTLSKQLSDLSQTIKTSLRSFKV